MSKNSTRFAIAVLVTVILLAAAYFVFRDGACKIDPPQTSSQSERDAVLKLAAELGMAKGTASEVESKFKQLSETQYQGLSDANVRLLLELRAIECYLHHGKVGEEIAKRMTEMVYRRTMAAHGVASGGVRAEILPLELSKLRASAQADEIIRLLEEFGYRQPSKSNH